MVSLRRRVPRKKKSRMMLRTEFKSCSDQEIRVVSPYLEKNSYDHRDNNVVFVFNFHSKIIWTFQNWRDF